MGKIVKGYWDCQYCGATGVSGDKRECTSCGHPRDESVTFYMKEVEYLSDEEASKVSRNADWYCSYCNTLNSDNDSNCKGCGASRDDSEKNYFDLQKEKNQPKEEFVPIKNTPKSKFSLWPFIIIGALVLLAFLFFRTKTKDGVIDSFAWSRNVQVEQYLQFEETAWENEVPKDAEVYDIKKEIHHYDQELAGYMDVTVEKSREVSTTTISTSDLGNGYFEEVEVPTTTTENYTTVESQPYYNDVPVYKDKYYYTVWRWAKTRDVPSNGDDQEPYYGELNLKEDEREGIKSGKYFINVTEGKKTKTYEMSEYYEDVWKNLKKGQSVVIKTSAGNSSLYDKDDNFLANLD